MTAGPVFLYGPPGAGKSTVGRALAEAWQQPFLDTDVEIERLSGRAIPHLFATRGEAGFRALERRVVADAVATAAGVVALGGGALLDADVRSAVVAAGPVLCLVAPAPLLVQRLAASGAARPLVADDLPTRLPALLAARSDHYASFAHQLDATLPVVDLVWQAQMATGRYHIRGMGRGYDVRVAPDTRLDVASWLPAAHQDAVVALVTDENVAALHLASLESALAAAGVRSRPVVIPAGEGHKNMTTVTRLWEAFLAAGLDRSGMVLALGGGVVGDLAGFAAATFLRGVAWAALPSTLLAMVDASLGGKTGADLPQGKNLVGAFHAPQLVLADTALLQTLPEAEIRSGLAEVVKHGLIADPALFELCAQGRQAVGQNWTVLVRRAVAVKARIIQEDPFEDGRRMALNLGHTIGHAVELASGYALRHGEAVAIGMVAEARLAERLGLAAAGLAAQVGRVLEGLGLPAELPRTLDPAAIVAAVGVDKKRRRGRVRFALPAAVGDVRVGIEAPEWPAMLLETG